MAEDGRPTFEIAEAGVGHRAVGWRKAIAWWLTAAGALGFVFTYPGGDYGWAVAASSIGATLLSWYYAATWSSLWSPPEVEGMGRVVVDEQRLTIEGQRRFSIPLSKITTRTSWQDRRGFVTHFRAKSGDAITVVHERPESAQALLAAAGERVLLEKLRLSSWTQQGQGREMLLGLALFGITSILPVVAIAVITAVILTAEGPFAITVASVVAIAILAAVIYATDKAIAEPLLTAGAEGLHLRGAVTRRFIRYRDLEAASLHRRGILLRHRSGKEEVLPTWRHGMWDLPATPEEDLRERQGAMASELLHKRARVLERIQAGIAAKGSSPMGDVQLALLDRKGRPLGEWKAAMEALLARADGGYREVRIDADALARVAENPAQPPDRRIGAALALARVDDAGVHQRLRVAAETCADERLRGSLERASRGEVEIEALAELEAEAAAQSTRAPRTAAR